MAKVIADITMSLDGYVTGSGADVEHGLGDAEELHTWVWAKDQPSSASPGAAATSSWPWSTPDSPTSPDTAPPTSLRRPDDWSGNIQKGFAPSLPPHVLRHLVAGSVDLVLGHTHYRHLRLQRGSQIVQGLLFRLVIHSKLAPVETREPIEQHDGIRRPRYRQDLWMRFLGSGVLPDINFG